MAPYACPGGCRMFRRLLLPAVFVALLPCSLIAQEAAPNTGAATATPAAASAPASAAEPLSAPVASSEPAAAPASVADPAPESSTASTPVAGQAEGGILVLPVEYIIYQKSMVSVEPVPEWTDASKTSLLEAATATLDHNPHFKRVALPQLSAEQSALLREHIELFKIIGLQLENVVKLGGAVWKPTRENANYSIGDGLRFLADNTGAKYAFLIAGQQYKQSAGKVFFQLAAAAGGIALVDGTGSYTYAGIVELSTGRVTWFSSSLQHQEFGIGGGDPRSAEGALKIISTLFKTYPQSPIANFGSGMSK